VDATVTELPVGKPDSFAGSGEALGDKQHNGQYDEDDDPGDMVAGYPSTSLRTVSLPSRKPDPPDNKVILTIHVADNPLMLAGA